MKNYSSIWVIKGRPMPANLKSRTNMASISKVTRNSNEAPSHLTINEWFNYASSTISAVGMFFINNKDFIFKS